MEREKDLLLVAVGAALRVGATRLFVPSGMG